MNITLSLCRCLLEGKSKLSKQFKQFHLSHSLKQRRWVSHPYEINDNIESSLWFTNLPSRKKRSLSLDGKEKIKFKNKNVAKGVMTT
ncbi:hypothetical protein RUM44_011877 [Polyplax serrata]|uniref:Uncharacterized protein n=1 Tax=Polyplax serrata TaxID=468196 RepID=A0ABR1BDM0_POLSC